MPGTINTNNMEVKYNLPNFKICTIEVPLAAGLLSGQYNFPINNYLIGRKIFGVETVIDADIVRSPISTNNLTWSLEMMQLATLTLHAYDPTRPDDNAGKADWVKDMPSTLLHRVFNTDNTVPGVNVTDKQTFAGLKPDWNNSYIRFLQPIAIQENRSAVFIVYYQ